MKMSLPIMAAVLLIGGGAGIGGLYYLQSQQNLATAEITSDSRLIDATITIGDDPWIGYAPLASNAMQSAARADGIVVEYVSDGGDYATRMQQIRDGDLDMAVVTIDANLLNTPDLNRGGVIVSVIDQSNGGDALVCDYSQISGIDDLSTTTGWNIAFTPNSPSHQLLRGIGNDFGADVLLQETSWRVETNGSGEALEQLQAGNVTCAVLWQPDVARALQGSNALGVVFSSADADGLIVDVLMVHRRHLLPSSPMRAHIQTVLHNYFEVLKEFSENEEFRLEQVKAYLREFDGARFSDDEIIAMLDGVDWVNLTENAESWFGVGGDSPYFKLEEAHDFARAIIRAEQGQDFLRFFRAVSVIDGQFIRTLYDQQTIVEHNATITNPLELRFQPLSELMWNTLDTQGTLRSRRIVFQPGSLVLQDAARAALGEAMQDFRRYPRSRLEIQVGYSPNGGAEAQADAQARADATRRYLLETHGLDENRVRVFVPEPQLVSVMIPQREGENGRAYGSRLREVQLVLRRPTSDS